MDRGARRALPDFLIIDAQKMIGSQQADTSVNVAGVERLSLRPMERQP